MLTQQAKEKDLKAEAKKDAMDGLQDNPEMEKFGPVIDAAIDQLFMAGQSFLRDADAAAVSLNLSDPGVSFGVVAQFKPDSYLANLFGKVKTTDKSLLGGPAGGHLHRLRRHAGRQGVRRKALRRPARPGRAEAQGRAGHQGR